MVCYPDGSLVSPSIGLDLAVVAFGSDLAGVVPLSIVSADLRYVDPGELKAEVRDTIHIVGFCETNEGVTLNASHGTIIGFESWELLYSAVTVEGMCGGPVLNSASQVIGIHRAGYECLHPQGRLFNKNILFAAGVRMDLFLYEELDRGLDGNLNVAKRGKERYASDFDESYVGNPDRYDDLGNTITQ
jgi:hypothetical protein